MEFGKFLFLYLLARNTEYFVYKSILDRVMRDEAKDDSGGPRIKDDLSKGGHLRRSEKK